VKETVEVVACHAVARPTALTCSGTKAIEVAKRLGALTPALIVEQAAKLTDDTLCILHLLREGS
jgi:hypothetical protein